MLVQHLYVWIDERGEKGDKRRDSLSSQLQRIIRRHPELGSKLTAADKSIEENFLDLFFPDGVPVHFQAANLSQTDIPERQLALSLRHDQERSAYFGLAPGCTLAVTGHCPMGTSSPVFSIDRVVEVAHCKPRPFERSMEVMVFQRNPRLSSGPRTNNILTLELARSLPPIAIATGKKLKEWSEFLGWKRNLVKEKTKGLRYLRRALNGNRMEFDVLAQTEDEFKSALRLLQGRNSKIMAFNVDISSDRWQFRLPEAKRDRGVRQQELGAVVRDNSANGLLAAPPEGCPWPQAYYFKLTIELGEEEQNALGQQEGLEQARASILDSFAVEGFIAPSAVGDMALIRRHDMLVKRLQEQSGYAPFLTSYLFDIRQANLPTQTVDLDSEGWFFDRLNSPQKEAVRKMLSAPDICLVQGPPGTGKTTVIAEAIMQITRRGQKVLLASQSHTAVDNALDRLGNHPGMRAIRLAHKADRLQDAKGFGNEQSLQRYYESLADHTQRSYLGPWQQTATLHVNLKAWQERAYFLLKDIGSVRATIAEHKLLTPQLDEVAEAASIELQAQHELHRQAVARREQLVTFRRFINDDVVETSWEMDFAGLPLEGLSDALFGLASGRVSLYFSPSDWAGCADRRTLMLHGLLGSWRRVEAGLVRIDQDIQRLGAAGSGVLLAPETALQIAHLDQRLGELQKRVEEDDDESLLQEWRALRRERKVLAEQAGGIDAQWYREMFKDADQWLSSELGSQGMLANLNAVRQSLAVSAELIRRELAALTQALDRLLAVCEPVPVSELRWLEAKARCQSHAAAAAPLHSRLAQHEEQARSHVRTYPERGEQEPADEALLTMLHEQAGTVLQALEAKRREQDHDRAIWNTLLEDWVADLRAPKAASRDWDHFKHDFVPQCNVVAVSCNERDSTLSDNGHTFFDYAIVDEVSKATPLELLFPLMSARTAILVGDHRQLPPLFQEGVDAQTFADAVQESEEEDGSQSALSRQNLNRFEKMVTSSLFKEHFERADDSLKATLEVQFRMHPQIMAPVNYFYENRLKCGLKAPYEDRKHGLTLVGNAGKQLLGKDDHILWVDTTKDQQGRLHHEDKDAQGRAARTNKLEAQLIAQTLWQIDQASAQAGYSPAKQREVGVVSFYAGQCRVIREAIRAIAPVGGFKHIQVDVNTVIRYQGKEKPIILISLTRHDGKPPEAREQVRRRTSTANVARYEFINVAMSRAKELLVVFGAKSMLESYSVVLPNMGDSGSSEVMVYREIFDDLKRQGRLVDAIELEPVSQPRNKPVDVRRVGKGEHR